MNNYTMHQKFQIQLANESHIEAITRLWSAYQRFYHQIKEHEETRYFVKNRIEQNESIIFIASLKEDIAHQIIGVMQLYPAFSTISLRKVWIVYDLFVDELYRGLGVGKSLLEAAAEFAKADGAFRLDLKTEHNNIQAKKLYEKFGFKQDEEHVYYRLDLLS